MEARQKAPDIFIVVIKRVDTVPEDSGNGIIVKAAATIDSIVRSSQAREIGEEIVIRYRTTAGTMYETAGDTVIPEQGEKIKVYLTYAGAGRYYRLAAGAFSLIRMNTAKQAVPQALDESVSEHDVLYSDPYRAVPHGGTAEVDATPERTHLNDLQRGGARPQTTDPYAADSSAPLNPGEKKMDPYEPIGL